MNLYLLSIGFVSILAQVVILRELNIAFFGVELIYVLAIAVWLLWTALGAMIGRRVRTASGTAIGCLFLAFSLLLPADVALVRGLRGISGAIPGAYLPFGVQLAGLFLVLLPIGMVTGILFQWAARMYIGKTNTLARAYAIESAGGLLGGLVSTLFLRFGIQNFMIAVLCSLAAVLTVLAAGSKERTENRSRDRARYAGAIALPVVLLLALGSPRLDRALTRINHPTLVASRDSPYSRITVTRQGDQFIVFENDALAFETQSVAAEELVHLAAAQADTLRRVAILGGGIEGTVAEILKYYPQRVDCVELNPVVISLIEQHLPRSYWEPLRSNTVRLVITDPRRFVRGAAPYDLILIGTPDPTSGQTNRFYTVEFFESCRAALTPNGILAFRLRSSENVWTPFVTYRNTSIFRALKAVFQDVVVLPGGTNIIVASDTPLRRDPVFLGERLKSRRIQTKLVTPQYMSYLYTNDRFFEIARLLSTTEIPQNTDVRPVCYKYSSMIWLSKFFPRLITADVGSAESSSRRHVFAYGVATLVLCGVFAASRRRVQSQRVVLAVLAGFVGMVLETTLILHYQVKSGVLYQNLGALLMAFMAGLAVGSGLVSAFVRSAAATRLPAKRTWGVGLFGGFSVANLAFIGFLKLDLAIGLAAVSLLLLVGGFLVSGVFAYATLLGEEDQRTLVSPLYAADLVGGCAGSVLASIVLIPFLGMEQTAGVMAVLSLAALLAV